MNANDLTESLTCKVKRNESYFICSNVLNYYVEFEFDVNSLNLCYITKENLKEHQLLCNAVGVRDMNKISKYMIDCYQENLSMQVNVSFKGVTTSTDETTNRIWTIYLFKISRV